MLISVNLLFSTVIPNESTKTLQVAKVNIKTVNLRTSPISNSDNILYKYSYGRYLVLEYCDKYNWCKIENKEQYVSKLALDITNINIIKKKINALKVSDKNISTNAIKLKNKVSSCIKIKQIDVKENEFFSKSNQNKALKKYTSKCVSSKVLKQIIHDVSSFYSKEGYITTKAFLKPQNITDGQIDIYVSSGIIQDIIHSDTNKSNSVISTAFIFQKGELLNLRNLETSLEAINRVPSSQAQFEIKPGKKKGESLILIKTKKTKPYHFSIGASASKSIKNKNPSLSATFSYDNLFNINDILSITSNGSRIQQQYQSTKGNDIDYSFSLGSYLYNLSYSNTSYRQGVVGINSTYLANGETIGKKIKITKILTRSQRNKLALSFLIYNKNSKNYFANELTEVSSYTTTLAQANLIKTYYENWGSITTTYSIYKGFDWFGAKTDDYNDDEIDLKSQSKLLFLKHSLDSNLNYNFTNRAYSINSNFHLQYTKDKLYNNDKQTVGSSSTVRGYSSSNLYGNNAWYVKNDFTKTMQFSSLPSLLQNISLFVGLDYGKVRCEDDNKEACGEVFGSSTGIKTNGKYFNSDFTWARALKNINKDEKIKNIFQYNITIKY